MILRWINNIFCKDIAPASNNFYSSEQMIFLGTEYGGWHLPMQLQLSCDDICYFIGAGEDISFDCAVAMKFPCQIHIFDPTPKAVAHFESLKNSIMIGKSFPVNNGKECYDISEEAMSRISFHPWGVAGDDVELKFYLPHNHDHVSCSVMNLQKTKEYFIAKCFTVFSIMQELGHKNIAVMKMDVEGAEYQVIKRMIADSIKPRLLAIEFDELHTPLDADAILRVDEIVSLLTSNGYALIYKNMHNFTFLLITN